MNLRDILMQTFKNSTIPEGIKDLKMGDVDEWDSLSHILLVVAIEKYFQIEFTAKEMQNFKNVGEMCEVIILKNTK